MTTREEATSQGDTSVVTTRVFDAPRELLWKAFTEPRMLEQWYAPEPLTVPHAETDVRPGGKYTLVMRDQDGNDFPSTGVYRDVIEPERLVYTDSSAEMPQDWLDMVNEARGAAPGTPVPDGIVTVMFEDIGGKTKVTFIDDFGDKAIRDAYVEMQMVEGLEGSWDILERVLAQQPSMAR